MKILITGSIRFTKTDEKLQEKMIMNTIDMPVGSNVERVISVKMCDESVPLSRLIPNADYQIPITEEMN